MPIINLIAAMAKHRTIGLDNQMPWHLPADLKHFKAITINHPVIMGRKTYQSIGKALPNRRNIVLTGNPDFQLDDAEVVNDLQLAIKNCADASEIMIIGGASLYQQMINTADRLYLTSIDLDVAGDTFFPDWHGCGYKKISVEEHPADEENPYSYSFITLERID